MTVLARSAALAALMLLAARSQAAAQGNPTTPNPGEVHGRVVDATGQAPIAGATVDVSEPGAPAPVARGSTDADGGFRVLGLRLGRYRVRVRAIGYTPRLLPAIEIGPAAPSVDVGTVTLTASPVELHPLHVTEGQQDVQLAPDRNTYVVRDLPTTRGGTALDVLRNVPAVDVDIDNIVSLRGNTGVIVQINGRPSPLKPAQLGNFLGQLPANVVDRVEVIPNPSAREDPEGVAGIINLVLKRRADPGLSGGLTLGGGTTGHGDIGGNLGYQHGPLSAYASYGFLRDRRPRNDLLFRENTYQSPVTFLDETGTRLQLPLAHTLTTTLGYDPGEHDELSADVIYSSRDQAESYDILYRDLDSARGLTGLSDRLSGGRNHEVNLEATLGYKHTFSGHGHTLSSELNIVREREGGPNRIAAHTLAPNGTPADTTALENQTAWEHPAEDYLKVDYARPLSSRVRLEAGYKGSLIRFHTTLATEVFDTAQAAYRPDSSRISDLTYRQLVHAGYGMLTAQFGKFVFQGGLRVERATTLFRLVTQGTSFDNDYNSVFPSALIAWNLDETHQVKLSYSSRIRRPDDTDQLDPTPRYPDPLNISLGNPDLKPEYIRAFELGLQRSAGRMTIQLTPFYRHTIDAVRQVRSIDTNGVTTRTFANVATSDAYGTDLTIARNGGRLSGFLSGSAYRQVSNAANLAPGLSAKTFGWSLRTNASFRFSPTVDVQALLSYRAPMTVEQGRNSSRTRFSFAARQKLMNERMSVTLRVIDPFNTSREINTTTDPRFTQVSDRRRAIRGLLLSVNWIFGRPERRGREDLIGNENGAP